VCGFAGTPYRPNRDMLSVCFLNTALSSLASVYTKTFLPFHLKKIKISSTKFTHAEMSQFKLLAQAERANSSQTRLRHLYGNILGRNNNKKSPNGTRTAELFSP